MVTMVLFLIFVTHTQASSCNVRDFGAKGDGTAIDSPAINKAISSSSCSIVEFPPGNYLSGSVRLKSHLTLKFDAGATLIAAKDNLNVFDDPEPNPYDMYQDFGHSHWHNSLIWGVGLVNITFTGAGTIDGAGLLASTPPNGGGNKVFGLKSCVGITISEITLRNTGWFALLATNCSDMTITGIKLYARRDGLDIVGCRRVLVDNVIISGGGDDALALKSDYSTGAVLNSYDIKVTNSMIGSNGCNALQFGSETVGPFNDILFENLTLTAAGKAGIGIVSMDGSDISGVTYKNITMTKTTTPFYMYIGARNRRPRPNNMQHLGSISNISLMHITSTHVIGAHGNFSSTIDGQPIDKAFNVSSIKLVGPGIKFTDISINYEGGGIAKDISNDPVHLSDQFPPRKLGVRPSYGWYIRNSNGITFDSMQVTYYNVEQRPGFVLDATNEITLINVTAERGAGLDYDVSVRNGGNVNASASNLVVHHDV
eukprot:m.60629 g.60629  ORF g.60629 m.60629 type:complete len:484 (+) comp11339_c0_seq3:286-1737(+)